MIVLKSLQKAMLVVGLLFTYSDKTSYRIYRWISFFILSSMIQPSCLYLYVNYKDLIKATEMCVFVVAEAVMMAKVLFIIFNQKSVVHLLKDLQEMANAKIQSNRTKLLFKYNNEAEMISKAFIGMLGIASCIFVGGPAMAIIYRKLQGTYVAHMYGHPYKGFFPYDFERTPGHEITYGLNCIYNVYLATYFAACDLLFVNCGLHLISATQDLEEFFKEIDTARIDELTTKGYCEERYLKTNYLSQAILQNISVCFQSSDFIVPSTHLRIGNVYKKKSLSSSLSAKLVEGIETHQKIIGLTDILASVEEGLIFSQFFGVLFSLSAIAFQVVSSEGEQRFFFIAPTIVILSQLLLYCYYGQRVTDQALKFSESIYQLHWYNYPLKIQKNLQLIMLRTQNPNYFSGLGFVKCSLESFADVLKFAGSVVTLFRNLQN